MRKMMYNGYYGYDEMVETSYLVELLTVHMAKLMGLDEDEFAAWDKNRDGVAWEMKLEELGVEYYFDDDLESIYVYEEAVKG